MTTQFVSEFSRHLQGQGSALALPLTWIEQLLAESNLTIEQLVQTENQQQAADQVSIGNSIGSLRVLGAMDWRTFVESVSLVEQALCQDPAGAYANMDFATRDHYRHVVEKIAKYSEQSEQGHRLTCTPIGTGVVLLCEEATNNVAFPHRFLPYRPRLACIRTKGRHARADGRSIAKTDGSIPVSFAFWPQSPY